MTDADDQPRGPVDWFRTGGWYFILSLASLGLLAWVPFLHAALRIGRARAAVLLVIESLVFLGLVVGAFMVPESLNSLGGGLFIGSAVFGALLQVPARRQAFLTERAPREPKNKPELDPAVAAVLAARTRRAEARKLIDKDPLMAHDLHIGRPDLHGGYDDGGLVDLGSAPASVIARVCELDDATAEAIVELRDGPVGLTTVDDVFSLTDTPLSAWDRIRDRAVIIPGFSAPG